MAGHLYLTLLFMLLLTIYIAIASSVGSTETTAATPAKVAEEEEAEQALLALSLRQKTIMRESWSDGVSPLTRLLATGFPSSLLNGLFDMFFDNSGVAELGLFFLLCPLAYAYSFKQPGRKKTERLKEPLAQKTARRQRLWTAPPVVVPQRSACHGAVTQERAARALAPATQDPQPANCALTDALHRAAKKGNGAGAARALRELEVSGTPTLQDYNVMISLCAKSSDPEGAHMWLMRVEAAGLQANAVCYNAVINAHAKCGDLQKAVDVAMNMVSAGVALDTVSYNTIIDACARSGDADNAECWMRKMIEAGVNPSVVSFGSVMLACARAGRSDKVEHWLEEADLRGIEINVICYCAVINAYAKVGDFRTANMWIKRMITRGVSPTIHCFTGMVDVSVKNQDLDALVEIVEGMKAVGVQPDAAMYNSLVTVSARAGDEERARSWAMEATDARFCLNRYARRALASKQADGELPEFLQHLSSQEQRQQHRQQLQDQPISLQEPIVSHESPAALELIGQRFQGTIKEYITGKFGYIKCDDTYPVFQRDIFLSSNDNPQGFARGQRVAFTLFIDRKRKLPRACDVAAKSASI